MRRREFIGLLGGAALWLPRVALGQPQSPIRRIGVLSQGSIDSHPTPEFRAFLERLRKLGWIENQSLLIEWRFSEGSAAPLARLATELVEKNVEVIVTTPTEPTIAAKHATSTIPIVFVGVADPLLGTGRTERTIQVIATRGQRASAIGFLHPYRAWHRR